MEVTQEPEDKDEQKKDGEKNVPPVPPVNKGTEISVEIDDTKKPVPADEKINLLNEDEVDDEITQKTEGDLENDEEKKKGSLNDFRRKTETTTSIPNLSVEKGADPDKKKRQAEKWVKVIDMAAIWGLKLWSGQADNVGLVTPQGDKDALAEALVDVFQEYNIEVNPILTLLITAGAMYATPLANAKASKKILDSAKKSEAYKKRQEEIALARLNKKNDIDPDTGKHFKKRGGQKNA